MVRRKKMFFLRDIFWKLFNRIICFFVSSFTYKFGLDFVLRVAYGFTWLSNNLETLLSEMVL